MAEPSSRPALPAAKPAVDGAAAATKPELRTGPLFRRLAGYLLPYRGIFIAATLCSMVAAATDGSFALLLKPLIDNGFSGASKEIWIYPAAIIGLFIVRGVFTFLNSYAMAYIGNRVLSALRVEMFDRLVALPAPYFDAHSSSSLVSRIVFEAQNTMQSTTSIITNVVRNSFSAIAIIASLLWINWRLTLFAVVVLPVVTVISRKVSRRMRELSRRNMHMTGELTRTVQETIDCQKVVKIYGGESEAREGFDRMMGRLRGNAMRISVTSSTTVPATQLLMASAMSAMIYFALQLSRGGGMTAGDFITFVTQASLLLQPIKQLAEVSGPLERGLAAAEGVFALIDERAEDDRGTRVLERARGEVRFVDVALRYRDHGAVEPQAPEGVASGEQRSRPAALDGIDVTIAAGETLALVGPSGSGKTSFANLIPRFYHATRGRILIDGVPIEDIRLASLREQVAMVSQDVVLFNDTIGGNIAYGASPAVRRSKNAAELRAAVRAAADAAYLLAVIEDLPDGLDTMIGENGVRLSGGQRQRLAIARAVLKDAPILILDEATSALDSESERHVQAALTELMRGRTTIVVAHRLSTIENADRIAVFDRGRIVEIGTHRALLAADGIYAKLYGIQHSLGHDVAGAPDVDLNASTDTLTAA